MTQLHMPRFGQGVVMGDGAGMFAAAGDANKYLAIEGENTVGGLDHFESQLSAAAFAMGRRWGFDKGTHILFPFFCRYSKI